MTLGRAILSLVAGGLAAGGCGGDGVPAADGAPSVDGAPSTDGGSPATCGSVQPCGGDVVGDWAFTETCESSARFAAGAMNFSTMAASSWCPEQTLVGIEPEASGTLALDAAGTYALAVEFGGFIDINYP